MTNRLALSGVVGFSLGVFVASLVPAHLALLGFLALLGASFFALFVLLKERVCLVATVFCLLAALGVGRVLIAPSELPESYRAQIGNEVTLSGTIVAPPDIRETTQRLTLETGIGGEKTRVLIITERFPEVSVGDTITAVGRLDLPEPFATNGGREFRYDLFLKKDGVFALLSFSEIVITGQEHGFVIDSYRVLSRIKPAFIDALGASLTEPFASLAGGLIVGGKEGLPDSLQDAFIQTGLIHIVVLSGYNVMIVADWVRRVFVFLSPRTRFGIAGIIVLLFVFAAGAGAASIRAGLMALIALFGRATGRTYDAVRALLFVGFIMLLQNPLLLPYDPGFQLSFIATLGLLLGTPLLERFFMFVRLKMLRELMCATLAAQIAVLPFLLFQTGLLSLVAFPANLLVLPIVPLAMGLSFFASIIGFIVPAIAPLAGLPALAVLGYITGVTETLATIPFSSILLPTFPFALVLVSYVLLGCVVYRATPRRASPLPPS
jgi:competence protein ComEC